MNDRSAPRGDHAGQEPAVEADGGKQVGVQLSRPVVLAEGCEAAGGRIGAAEVVDEDVDTAKAFQGLVGGGGCSLG